MSGKGSALHPSMERAWDEVHACVQRGGTFVLRPAPGGAVLLPIPAWKLRALTCQELADLLARPQPDSTQAGGEPLPDDVQHDALVPTADVDARRARRCARKRRWRLNRSAKRAAASAAAPADESGRDGQGQGTAAAVPLNTSAAAAAAAEYRQLGLRGGEEAAPPSLPVVEEGSASLADLPPPSGGGAVEAPWPVPFNGERPMLGGGRKAVAWRLVRTNAQPPLLLPSPRNPSGES